MTWFAAGAQGSQLKPRMLTPSGEVGGGRIDGEPQLVAMYVFRPIPFSLALRQYHPPYPSTSKRTGSSSWKTPPALTQVTTAPKPKPPPPPPPHPGALPHSSVLPAPVLSPRVRLAAAEPAAYLACRSRRSPHKADDTVSSAHASRLLVPAAAQIAASVATAADQSEAQSRAQRGNDPDGGICHRTRRLDAGNGHGARQVRVDARHKGRHRRPPDHHLGLGRVAPEVPPHRLPERRIHGVELAQLVVLLGLARRGERREDEEARRRPQHARYGKHSGIRRRVRGLHAGQAGKVDDQNARQHEPERQGEDHSVDSRGQSRRIELHRQIDELAVTALARPMDLGEGRISAKGTAAETTSTTSADTAVLGLRE
ncbi:hypothetical protein ACCO45_001718 [Purpureocillium lilacinum]|uniref:Uncharacterized protein n=1 Tax=Purpureocillium lilacinum TaxID=33203 RepID=A0ACC4E7U4_PURLI